jgi:hypothetical protein
MAEFVKKTWKDRIAEYINRRELTKEDGSSELVTVSRSEGEISEEGDAFSAENMNDLEDRIDTAVNELNDNLTTSLNDLKIMTLTESKYSALTKKDENTLYFING